MYSNNQEQAMQTVRETGFALTDITLFLDTHPNDEKAMDYYNKYQQMHKEARSEYEKKYGPLTSNAVDTNNGWTWTQNPWPWEGGCC